jgi:hypothetical protein
MRIIGEVGGAIAPEIQPRELLDSEAHVGVLANNYVAYQQSLAATGRFNSAAQKHMENLTPSIGAFTTPAQFFSNLRAIHDDITDHNTEFQDLLAHENAPQVRQHWNELIAQGKVLQAQMGTRDELTTARSWALTHPQNFDPLINGIKAIANRAGATASDLTKKTLGSSAQPAVTQGQGVDPQTFATYLANPQSAPPESAKMMTTDQLRQFTAARAAGRR